MKETIKTIMGRRSTRAYKELQIKEEELYMILRCGRFAPSAMNQQPWHFTVVQDKELLNQINETCKAAFLKSGNERFQERAMAEGFNIFYNSPTLIIISADEKAIAPQVDSALALQNMFLGAEALGIGSCWINAIAGVVNKEEDQHLRKALGIPEGYIAYCAGAFGYKAMDAQAPERKENVVTVIK